MPDPNYARALAEWDSPELGQYGWCMSCKVIHRYATDLGMSCKGAEGVLEEVNRHITWVPKEDSNA